MAELSFGILTPLIECLECLPKWSIFVKPNKTYYGFYSKTAGMEEDVQEEYTIHTGQSIERKVLVTETFKCRTDKEARKYLERVYLPKYPDAVFLGNLGYC